MANFKRKRPKEHTWYTCGQKCRYDRTTIVGNNPFLYKPSDRVRMQMVAEQIREYNASLV